MTTPHTAPVTSLAAWLATRSAQQLSSMIVLRPEAFSGHDPRTLEELAERLTSSHAVERARLQLTLAGHQVLTAAARLATEFEPPKAAQIVANIWTYQAYHYGYRPGSHGGTVGREELLGGLGAGQPGAAREAVLRLLDELSELALLWPHGEGALAVPGAVLDSYQKRQEGEARTIDRNLTSSFNKEPVGIIAETLGVGRATTSRNVLQAAIVAYLSDEDKVRTLVDSAPPDARHYLHEMLINSGIMATNVFVKESSYSNSKYLIADSYPDPDSLWLARRGLILPSGTDRAEVPVEVARALRNGASYPFSPQPPTLPHGTVPAAQARGETQAALTGAVAKMGRLLEALDQQPVAPRKTGGLPVRETRRLAKVTRLDETETRFWIGIADQAGLIGLKAEFGVSVLCPTEQSDGWLARAPSERVALLLRAWLNVGDVITWWPFTDETPIAYGDISSPYPPPLRRAVLRAMAALPAGAGCLSATPVINLNGSMPAEAAAKLDALTRVATWVSPMIMGGARQAAEQVLHTVYEAELLGVAAHGALSDVGQVLIDGDDDAVRATVSSLLPAEQTTARFQTDMTVVVTGTPSAALAALLGTVADRESDGHAVVYRISAATIRRALDVGIDATDLLTQLTEVADGELPQALVYTIKEVGRAHGKMRVVRSACCIRCDDPAMIAELASAKGLAPLGLRRIAPSVLISVNGPTETLAALRSAGYAPMLEAETGTTVVERVRGKRATARPRQSTVPKPARNALKVAQRLLHGAASPGSKSRTPVPV